LNLLDQQPDLFDFPDLSREVDAFVRSVIGSASRPSPGELVAKFNKELGPKARWDLERIVRIIAGDQKVSRFDRDYLSSLLAEDSLAKALRGENVPEPKKASTIDELFRHSKLYKNSADFNDLVKFMGRFAVADDKHEGSAASVVVSDSSGRVLNYKPTTVGEET
jgi:hypothetical protein